MRPHPEPTAGHRQSECLATEHGAARVRRLASALRGSGSHRAANSVVSISSALPTEAVAGAIFAENSRSCAGGDSSFYAGSIDWSFTVGDSLVNADKSRIAC